MFIVFEGVDGCGKSTQARILADWIESRGRQVHLTAEPTQGHVGRFIREVLSSELELDPKTLSLLFVADRIQHLKEEVEPALLSDKVVISERYTYSTIAYQSAQDVSRDWLLYLNDFRTPDLSILLDVPPERAAEKIREKIEKEKEEAEGARKKFESQKMRFEEHRRKFEEHRKRFHNLKKNPYVNASPKDGGKLKDYYDHRNSKKAADQMENLLSELLEFDESRMAAEQDYEAARTKYLKFEKFERPTTLESDTSEYESFLKKVYENYHLFDDLTVVDGTQPIDKVSADITEIVGSLL